MKKWISAILCAALCMGLLGGCGVSLEGDESVVYVDKKGIVYSLDVESLDQDFYDEAELETFVNEAVEAYVGEHGKGAVKMEGLTTEDGVAKLRMRYKTTQDYTDFNGIELYQGEVVDSLAAGYVYEGPFARVEDGKVLGSATKQEIYADEDLKVVIIRANTNVKVDGEIRYVSCENVRLTGEDSVSIRSGYNLDIGSEAAVEAVAPGTESLAEESAGTEGIEVEADIFGTEQTTDDGSGQEDTGSDASGSDSFETDVYTFIIYK